MKLLCFALFALAFNLLIGYVGLLSFGHAAYFGMGGYIAGHAAKVWGLTPEVAVIARCPAIDAPTQAQRRFSRSSTLCSSCISRWSR